MKLFKVITEHEHEGKDRKIEIVRQYVTQADNDIGKVTAYFVQHCKQYELVELRGVYYIADIVQHIE